MDDSTTILDPDGKYQAEDLRRCDRLALAVLDLLPEAVVERTRDVYQINHDGDEGIVVVITPEAMELRLPTVDWTHGAYGPVLSSRLWKRYEINTLTDNKYGEFQVSVLMDLLKQAQAERRKEFSICHFCGRNVPREHSLSHEGKVACHGCATEHLDIVF
jgi:formylmethanofuran dehydrogenase subunit E